MDRFSPEYLILHDYGGSPGAAPSFNPYHTLISGGRVNYRDPKNPYGAPAPHAYKLNPKSIGLSWGGKVGGNPSKEEFALIKQEYDAIKKQFPNIKVMSHGEAYQQTRGTGQQASRDGRGLEEASWRKFLDGNLPYEPGTVAPAGPTPMGQRSLTAYAGVSKTQPTTTGTPQPMPSYKNVGGQQFMGPETAQSSQKLAQMLISQGMEQQPMTHWTQALGKVLMTGSGALRNDMAMKDMREGQQAGNQALAQLLMGGDASAAMANPYSAPDAMKYQMENNSPIAKQQNELRAAQIEKMRAETAAANAERERQKSFDSMIMGTGPQPSAVMPSPVPSEGVGRFAQPNLVPRPQSQGGSIQDMFAALPPNVKAAAQASLAAGDREGAVKIITQNSIPPKKSVTEMKTILEAENQAISLDNSIKTLDEALALISEDAEKKGTAAFEGFGAGLGGWAGSRLPDVINPLDKTKSKATDEYNNIMNMEAISAMSEKLKGATTDRELAEFQRILSDASQPRETRRKVIGRMKRLLQQQADLAKRRTEEMRTGTYFRNPNGVAPSSGITGATDAGDGFTIEVEQ